MVVAYVFIALNAFQVSKAPIERSLYVIVSRETESERDTERREVGLL
jgi:hypothetical protein